MKRILFSLLFVGLAGLLVVGVLRMPVRSDDRATIGDVLISKIFEAEKKTEIHSAPLEEIALILAGKEEGKNMSRSLEDVIAIQPDRVLVEIGIAEVRKWPGISRQDEEKVLTLRSRDYDMAMDYLRVCARNEAAARGWEYPAHENVAWLTGKTLSAELFAQKFGIIEKKLGTRIKRNEITGSVRVLR